LPFNVFSFPKVESGLKAPTLRGGGRLFGLCLAGDRISRISVRNLHFINTFEKRQGIKIAFDKKYISRDQLRKLATPLIKNEYGKYLMKIVDKKYYSGSSFQQLSNRREMNC